MKYIAQFAEKQHVFRIDLEDMFNGPKPVAYGKDESYLRRLFNGLDEYFDHYTDGFTFESTVELLEHLFDVPSDVFDALRRIVDDEEEFLDVVNDEDAPLDEANIAYLKELLSRQDELDYLYRHAFEECASRDLYEQMKDQVETALDAIFDMEGFSRFTARRYENAEDFFDIDYAEFMVSSNQAHLVREDESWRGAMSALVIDGMASPMSFIVNKVDLTNQTHESGDVEDVFYEAVKEHCGEIEFKEDYYIERELAETAVVVDFIRDYDKPDSPLPLTRWAQEAIKNYGTKEEEEDTSSVYESFLDGSLSHMGIELATTLVHEHSDQEILELSAVFSSRDQALKNDYLLMAAMLQNKSDLFKTLLAKYADTHTVEDKNHLFETLADRAALEGNMAAMTLLVDNGFLNRSLPYYFILADEPFERDKTARNALLLSIIEKDVEDSVQSSFFLDNTTLGAIGAEALHLQLLTEAKAYDDSDFATLVAELPESLLETYFKTMPQDYMYDWILSDTLRIRVGIGNELDEYLTYVIDNLVKHQEQAFSDCLRKAESVAEDAQQLTNESGKISAVRSRVEYDSVFGGPTIKTDLQASVSDISDYFIEAKTQLLAANSTAKDQSEQAFIL